MPTYSASLDRTSTRLRQPFLAKSSSRRRHSAIRSGATIAARASRSSRSQASWIDRNSSAAASRTASAPNSGSSSAATSERRSTSWRRFSRRAAVIASRALA